MRGLQDATWLCQESCPRWLGREALGTFEGGGVGVASPLQLASFINWKMPS